MAKYLEFDYEYHDYRASYPPAQHLEMFDRGGNFANEPSPSDQEVLVAKCNELNGLLNGELRGYSVVYQNDALHPNSSDIRDEIVHQLGVIAGFDVHGELDNSQMSGEVVISDMDMQALGISTEFSGVALPVSYKSVQFGFIPTESDWQISEYEIPTAETITNTDTEETYPRVLRILNMVQLPQQ